MGIRLSTLLSDWWNGKKPIRLLMIGLDNAGKTTILYKLKLNEVVSTIPTIGFNVENITYKNLSMTIWDVGGQFKIRILWKYYYQGTQVCSIAILGIFHVNLQGLIYVVDSNDKERMGEVKENLHGVMEDDTMRGVKFKDFGKMVDF